MSKIKKNISLIATFLIILIACFGGYYLINLNRGPYPASSFVSISYKWGVGDTLINSYNSVTGDYQYLDSRDSLIKTKVKLNANNVIFLHSKANEVDFWTLPELIANSVPKENKYKVLRYEMIINYEEKTKKIIYYTDYSDRPAIDERAKQLQQVIEQTIDYASQRSSSN